MKRNPSIELYRIALMFGVVMIHTVGHSVVWMPWLSCMFMFCVTGFVFVTGYFGIIFKFTKLLRLYWLAIVCVLIDGYIEGGDVLATSFLHLKQCWFLHAYAGLMLFAPMINAALDKNGWEWPLLFLTFGWSYAYDIVHLRPFIFPIVGLGSHTLLTLIGVYVAGRLFRKHDLESKISTPWVAICATLLFAFGALRLSRYNSPFAVILSAALFVLFKRCDLTRMPRLANCILFLSPSMFAVYVLHNSDYNEALGAKFGALLISHGVPPVLSCLFMTIIIFSICLFADFARRGVFHACRKTLRNLCNSNDGRSCR